MSYSKCAYDEFCEILKTMGYTPDKDISTFFSCKEKTINPTGQVILVSLNLMSKLCPVDLTIGTSRKNPIDITVSPSTTRKMAYPHPLVLTCDTSVGKTKSVSPEPHTCKGMPNLLSLYESPEPKKLSVSKDTLKADSELAKKLAITVKSLPLPSPEAFKNLESGNYAYYYEKY